MSNTYSAVDRAPDVTDALEWQDRIDSWPQVRAYKQRSLALIGNARPVLDVGCGTGLDLEALGVGAVGVDASEAMCSRAASRGGVLARADALRLPFGDGTFGAARTDRVIQHVADPLRAIHELVRVTRPGGRVVICDPDQESLVIALPGVRPALTSAVKRLRRDVGYRNGTIASQLPAILGGLGLRDVTVDAYPLLLTDPDDAFGLPDWPRYFGHAHEVGTAASHPDAGFTADDIREWDEGIAAARTAGGLVYSVLYFVVSGEVAIPP